MATIITLVARAVFSLGTFAIVGVAVLDAWTSGQPLLALAAFVAAPLTFFVYPWVSDVEVLRLVWGLSMVAFAAGNIPALVAGRRGVRG